MVAALGARVGGRIGLAALLTEHGEAIEADLQRWYGVELGDRYRGRLTDRRLLVLIRHLPRDSALMWDADPETAAWGLAEQLSAAQTDALNMLAWMYANRNQRHPTARPKRIRRPGVDDGAPRRLGTALPRDEAVARLAQLAPKVGGADGS